MTVLYSVTTGNTILAADLNQYKSMLEGASGYTSTYKLVSTAGTNFVLVLGDSSAANKLSVQDAAGNEVWSVNSDGAVSSGALTPTSLVIPNSGAPAQTTSGSAVWDTVNEILTIANGSTRKDFYPGLPVVKYKTATQVFTTDTTFADITASSGNLAFSIGASEIWMVEFYLPMTYGGTGGLKLQLTGPAAPTLVRVDAYGDIHKDTTGASNFVPVYSTLNPGATAFSSQFVARDSGASANGLLSSSVIHAQGLIVNGSTAGTVTLQGAQNSSNSTTTFAAGCWMRATRLL